MSSAKTSQGKLHKLRGFRSEERGVITVFGLFLFTSIVMVGGLAIDMANLLNARTQLQVAADLTAHAALYARDTVNRPEDAKDAALDLVEGSMPDSKYGRVIQAKDITFGHYNAATDKFTPDPNSSEAVHVYSTRLSEKANPVSTFVLRILGFLTYDVAVEAIFTTFRPACFREGFVADGPVDLRSNNGFSNGFCIHSNDYVSMNNGNMFEAGTVVSMPDTSKIDLPTSGWKTNTGLRAALRQGVYRLRVVNNLPFHIRGLRNRDRKYLPSYIDPTRPVRYLSPKNGKGITMEDLTPGLVHDIGCHNNGVLTIDEDVAIENVVIVTDCKIKFGQALRIENAVIATAHEDIKSMTSSSNLIVGKQDNCAPGGAGQLLTLGGMEFTSGLSIFGSKLVAKKDIVFTANADGIQGASIVSGGSISGTSNMNMGFCGTGMTDVHSANYFRLAR